MFLQTNRRKFLGQTALGAGSMLFFPGLLTSCTDHRIPGPGDPAVPPVGDEDYDGNDIAKTCVVTALGMIPEVGEILAALVEIFWPETKEDPWDEVKDRVEVLIKKNIDELVYQQVKEDLGGFKNGQPGGLVGLMTLYLDEVKAYNETLKTNPNASPEGVIRQWVSTRAAFVNALPHFQADNYEDLLLPLFVPFASMHLALLRDIVIDGKAWGRSEAEHQQDILDLRQAITSYADYGNYTFGAAYDDAFNQAPRNDGGCEPEATMTRYTQEMIPLIYDYIAAWPYFDVTLYPNGPRVPIERQIYSGMKGYCKGYNLVKKYGFTTSVSPASWQNPPTKAPTQITIWGGEVIEGIQVTYPANSGPSGVTQTVRMGLDSLTGGSNQPPKGGTFHISPTNPIVLVRLSFNKYPPQYDDVDLGVSAIQFVYKDGATSPWTGTLNNSYIIEVKPPSGHYVSSIYFGAYLVVFGFQYMNLQLPAGTDAMRTIYITSPTERTADDFTKAFPELGDSSTLITEELKADREAHWASFKARAATLK